jgi:hypothetical protein
MNSHLTLLLCAVSLVQSPTSQGDLINVPLTDLTGKGTPFLASGTALLRETVRGNQLEWSWGQRLSVKNISGKPVLLLVAALTERGRHPTDGHAAPGDGPTYRFEKDRFFDESLIEPEETVILRDTEPGVPQAECCVNPLEGNRSPAAEYRLQFVQFSDGSTFGDASEAKDDFEMRDVILRNLRRLLRVYADGGEAGLATRLKELQSYMIDPNLAPKTEGQPPFFATSICSQILTKYNRAGAEAALAEAKKILGTAEKHAAMIEADRR